MDFNIRVHVACMVQNPGAFNQHLACNSIGDGPVMHNNNSRVIQHMI